MNFKSVVSIENAIPLLFLFYAILSRKVNKNILLFIAVVCSESIISNVFAVYQRSHNKSVNNLIVYHIGSFLKFLSLKPFFSTKLNSRIERGVLSVLELSFWGFGAFNIINNFLTGKDIFQLSFNSNTLSILSIWVVLQSLIYYTQYFRNPDLKICCGALVFGTFQG